ncbi:MAG: hypothetical protein SAMD01599839_03130 [Rectinema sp.]
MENDPDWDKDPAHAGDSRWVHRPVFREALFEERHDPATVTGRVFTQFKKMIRVRATHRIFAVRGVEVIESGHPAVLIFRKVSKDETLIVIGSFSERSAEVSPGAWKSLFEGKAASEVVDLLSDRHFVPEMPPEFLPCELVWLYMPNGGRAQKRSQKNFL